MRVTDTRSTIVFSKEPKVELFPTRAHLYVDRAMRIVLGIGILLIAFQVGIAFWNGVIAEVVR
jgi:hypothetical protein